MAALTHMAAFNLNAENSLQELSIPMPSLGIDIRATADQLAQMAHDALATEMAWGLGSENKQHLTEFSIVQVGSLSITSGRTTPVALQYKQGDRITVELCFAGQSRFRDGLTDMHSEAGQALMFANHGGILCGGLHSGISFCLDPQRLEKTARAMFGGELPLNWGRPMLIRPNSISRSSAKCGLLFSLFQHIDNVLAEGRSLPGTLALDDQIYRTVALKYGRSSHGNKITRAWEGRRRWASAIDDLIDFIQQDPSRTITLTDLEDRSHYSARHLQNLFRERFDCTPMQFVRRQKLSAAMEKLQTGKPESNVTQIARECGYRFTSNFSADFQREFGINPSQVLRASKRNSGRQL